MTNRDRLIEALRGTAPNAVYRHVLLEQINFPYLHENKGLCRDGRGDEWVLDEMCIACVEDWLSQEIDYELEGMENGNV